MIYMYPPNEDSEFKPTIFYFEDPYHLTSKFKEIKYIFDNNIQYISDLIGTDWLYKWTPNVPIFISAQTGRGKNYFIQNTMIPEILKHNRQCNDNQKILVLSNRIALNHQNKIELAKIIDIYLNNNKFYENTLQRLTDEQINTFNNFGNVLISSYHQLLNNNLLDDDYAFVIIDECHFFTQDSLFNADTSKILDAIIDKCKNSIRIYLSATLNDVLPIILEKDIFKKFKYSPYEIYIDEYAPYLNNAYNLISLAKQNSVLPFYYNIPSFNTLINTSKIKFISNNCGSLSVKFFDKQQNEITPYYDNLAIVYDLEPNYNYIKTHLIKNNNDALIDKISHTHSKDSKWIIFVKSKKEGETLKEKLNQKQISSEFISSESKTKSNTAYQQIIKECKFDVEVLISTAVIDNGVNIKDKAVKNIAISIFDYTSFIQMLGRIRPTEGQEINLYLFDFSINKIEQNINKTYNELLEHLYFDSLSSDKQLEHYISNLNSGALMTGFNYDPKTKKAYHSNFLTYKLLSVIYNLVPFIRNLDSRFKLKESNLYQKNKLIYDLEDISSQERLSLFQQKCLLVLKDNIFPKKRELYIEPSIINDKYIEDIFYNIYSYGEKESLNKTLNLYDELTTQQYFYLDRIKFFMEKIIELNKKLHSFCINLPIKNKNKIDEIKKYRANLISKIEKYVQLFNHNDLSFDYKDISCSPIIYRQLLWLEKFELDSTESANNQTLTKEKLIEELNSFAISKQEYSETKTDNAARNDLLTNKGFPSNDKDNEPIYQKIQELITNIKGKGDFKTTKKINDFFSEQHIPFEIISAQTTTNKKTYWLILKLE